MAAHILGAADDANAALALNVVLESRGNRKDPSPAMTEGAQERVVLKFTYDHWANFMLFKPEIQISS